MTYSPTPGPRVDTAEAQRLLRWLEQEFLALARWSNEEEAGMWLQPLAVEPAKPRAGLLAYADGTNWNPGSGEGLYRYSVAGSWVFIG